ncbi:hypothetical protein AJ88_14075 [Mesorhizobium amorphae CCBAU 01583]|nr:hypothetical protein AJ88_14075 [Mesorhizobium amorphae CCBAU 01583]
MSFQIGSRNESFERLRKLLLDLSRNHVLKAAALGRVRSQPAKAVDLTADNANLGMVVNNLRSAVNTLVAMLLLIAKKSTCCGGRFLGGAMSWASGMPMRNRIPPQSH